MTETQGEATRSYSGFSTYLSTSKGTPHLRVSVWSEYLLRDAEAAQVSKTLSLFGVVLDNITPRSAPLADQFFRVLLDNANTVYNEVGRKHP